MSAPTALLDACTLVPIRVTSCLLSLAEAGLFVPLWSEGILEEVERNLPRLKGVDPNKARRRVAAIKEAFGDEASVEGYEDMVPRLTCHLKDRHVLVAAIAGGVDVLVTFNIKDFPPDSVEPHGVVVLHPDEFMTALLDHQPEVALDVLRSDAARYRRPQTTLAEYLDGLRVTVPRFADRVAELG